MKIQDFTGGLSTRLDPQFLGLTEAVRYHNIDNSKGSLTPVKSNLPTDIEVDKYQFFSDSLGQWFSSETKVEYLEYQGKVFEADGENELSYTDQFGSVNTGIEIPDTSSSAANPFEVIGPSPTTVETASTAGLPVEDTYYAINKYNTVSGETGPYTLIKVLTDGTTEVTEGFATVDVTRATALDTPSAKLLKLLGTNTIKKTNGEREITLTNVTATANNRYEVYRLYNGAWRQVGTFTDVNQIITDNTYDISGNTELAKESIGLVEATYQYAISYYDSVRGVESGLQLLGEELELEAISTVNVAGIPTATQARVDTVRIYRVGLNIAEFTLVAEVANGTALYEDQLNNLNIEGGIATTQDNSPPPVGISDITEFNGQLFGCVGSKVYFTPVGNVENWPTTFFLNYPVDIVGLVAIANGVLVFTKFKTYIITGTNETNLASQLLDGSQGCIDSSTIQQVDNSAMWLSTDGICTSYGSGTKVLSRAKLGKLTVNPISSTVYDEVYYVLTEDNILAFDYGLGGIFKTFDNTDLDSLVVAQDALYARNSETGVLDQLFAGEEYKELSYTSPRFIEGASTNLKTYKKFYVRHHGDATVNLYVDDELVQTIELVGDGVSTMQFPSGSQRGTYLQVEITSSSTILEYEYQAEGRNT